LFSLFFSFLESFFFFFFFFSEDSQAGALGRRRTVSSLYDLDDFVPSIAAPAMVTPLKVKEVFVPTWKVSLFFSFSFLAPRSLVTTLSLNSGD